MAFRNIIPLSSDQRACIDAEAREVERLHGVGDRWLAEELLRLARRVRSRHAERLADPHAAIYENRLLWQLIPELAHRLGARSFLPNERSQQETVRLSDRDLRCRIGYALQNASLPHTRLPDDDPARPTPEDLLLRIVQNGNPVAIAVDRLAPAPAKGEDRDDPIARLVREISVARGHPETAAWSPALQARSASAPGLEDIARNLRTALEGGMGENRTRVEELDAATP